MKNPSQKSSLKFIEQNPKNLNLPDGITNCDQLYLIRQRVENLRQKIGVSIEEILELRQLESVLKVFDNDLVVNDLGVSGKIDQFIAALESKRVDRYERENYDGGAINDESISSIDEYYQNLFKNSYINVKSIAILNQEKKPLFTKAANGQYRKISVFDLYKTACPKHSFMQFLCFLWQLPEQQVSKQLAKTSTSVQWQLKEKWQKYLAQRELSVSEFQQVLLRCADIARSPIYKDMKQTKEDHYKLIKGYELRFTDKTGILTLPISELADIACKKVKLMQPQKIAFIKVAFILPKYAHEKKRFFKKGGEVGDLAIFLKKAHIEISSEQRQYLEKLLDNGFLRIYKESLDFKEQEEIRGFFLNFPRDMERLTKEDLLEKLRLFLKKQENLIVRQVTPFSIWYPEWMRKIGGIIIETKSERSISVDKKPKLHKENLLMPSKNLDDLPADNWENAFVQELRERYRRNPQFFIDFAKGLEEKYLHLHCECDNHGSPHKNRCRVPVLESIFQKITKNTINCEK